MFVFGKFDDPPPSPPFYDSRVLGMIVLMIGIVLCLFATFSLDAQVVLPYKATAAFTETASAQQTRSPKAPTPTKTILPPINDQRIDNQQ